MSIYISKNNQQAGPFVETEILQMLEKGEFSPNDLAIRHGEKEWQKLSVYFPNVGNAVPISIVTEEPTPKKSRKGLLLGCSGFLVILLIVGVLGVLALRNKFPSQTDGDLPEMVKTGAVEYKLKDRNRGSGDIWGTKKEFVAIYFENGYADDYEKRIYSLLSVYADEKTAKDGLEADIREFCKDAKAMRFSFLDENKKELSTGATCGMPLFVLKDNKIYSISIISKDAAKTVDNSTRFAENLPFNQGLKMTSKTDK